MTDEFAEDAVPAPWNGGGRQNAVSEGIDEDRREVVAATKVMPDSKERTEKTDRFPAGIPYIVGNEGAERFSFYGMKAVLYVYLTALYLQFAPEASVSPATLAAAKARGTEIVHLFIAGVYAFPLIGAVVADRLFGKVRVILWVSVIYCIGQGVLAFAGHQGALGELGLAEWGAYLGLGLIAFGSGGIKPCVSANVGDQFTAANGHLVTKVFQIFYFIINYGSFFSTLLTPILYKTYGPAVAFGVPGVLMAVATIVFWAGRGRFVPVEPRPGGRLGLLDSVATILLFSPLFSIIYGYFVMFEHFDAQGATGVESLRLLLAHYVWLILGSILTVVVGLVLFGIRQKIAQDTGFLAVLLYSVRHRRERAPGAGLFSVARAKFGEEAAEGPPAVLRIMLVFSMVSVFWALFDQHSSTWVEQAKQMDLAMRVPEITGYYVLVSTVVLSLGAGLWLMLRVANVIVPRKVIVGVLSVALGGLVVALVGDAVRGRWASFTLQPAQLAALNPLMVMMIIPLLNVAVYGPLERRGRTIRPLQKMTVGMFMAAFAFTGAAIIQLAIESKGVGQVHALWQSLPYLVMTASEVLVSVTGLEFAYTQAPRAMKSTIVGFWLLCVTFGNLIVAFLAPLQKSYELSLFFGLFAGLMLVAAVLFAVMAYFYKGKSYLQHA